MEGYILKHLDTAELSREFPYSCRYRMEDGALAKSVEERGIVAPLLVTARRPHVIISGHKRFQAALACGLETIPALVLDRDPSEAELFALSVLSNSAQAWLPLEEALAAHRAVRNFGFSYEDVRGRLLPLISKDSGRRNLDDLLKTAALDPLLLEAVWTSRLPFRGAACLSRLGPEDQKYFAREIAGHLRLSSSQLEQAVEWLGELCRQKKSSVAEVLESRGLLSITEDPRADERQKTDLFMKKLRGIRFPKLTETEKAFRERAKAVEKELPAVKIEAPEGFEAPGLTLRLQLRDAEHLEEVLRGLKTHQTSINSLFKIVL